MKTKDALLKLKNFLTPERWTKGVLVRDYCGKVINNVFEANGNLNRKNVNDECKFCLWGAIYYLEINNRAVTSALIEQMDKYDNIEEFNDAPETKFSDVHKVIDGAIASCEN